MLTPEQKERVRALSLALVGERYILGTEIDLAKVLPGMEIQEVCDLVPALDCSEMVQVVFKWATGIEVVDLAAKQYDASVPIESIGLLEPEVGDLGFKRIKAKIAHVGIFVGEWRVVEARGKDYGVVIRDAKAGWQNQTVFAGWRRLRQFVDSAG